MAKAKAKAEAEAKSKTQSQGGRTVSWGYAVVFQLTDFENVKVQQRSLRGPKVYLDRLKVTLKDGGCLRSLR